MLVVRHGHAGTKAAWTRADHLRPLSELGAAQARTLPELLASDEVTAIWCSPAVRCRQTVEVLAAERGLAVRTTDRLGKDADPSAVLGWLREAGPDAGWLVCTHGEVITAVASLARAAGLLGPAGRATTEKGAAWRLHAQGGLVRAEYVPPHPYS